MTPALDTSKTVIPVIFDEDNIVHQPGKDSLPRIEENPIIDDFPEDDIVTVDIKDKNTIQKEEPYKIITNAAGNLLNRDVSFTRNLNTESKEYVAYQFKIGKFGFERKKSK